MDVKRKIPHEGVKNNEDGLPLGPEGARFDGLPEDVEGHARVTGGEDLTIHGPSTGGDGIAPDGTGDDDDAEGHRYKSGDSLTVNPGTGGDFAPRRPSTGGEFIDENDVEGHVLR
jgi:hypothetical protein